MALLPFTLKDLKDNPVITILFACLIGISVLYADNKWSQRQKSDQEKEERAACEERFKTQGNRIAFLEHQGNLDRESKRVSDSIVNRLTERVELMIKYGKN